MVGSGAKVGTGCITIGINDAAIGSSFLVYPNPSTCSFKITFAETVAQGEVEVLDVNGRSVFKESLRDIANTEINLNSISEGIYFVRLFNGEVNSISKIIIMQH